MSAKSQSHDRGVEGVGFYRYYEAHGYMTNFPYLDLQGFENLEGLAIIMIKRKICRTPKLIG